MLLHSAVKMQCYTEMQIPKGLLLRTTTKHNKLRERATSGNIIDGNVYC
jgi:hypothetical protein